MKYNGYMPNDFINGLGVSVSLWTAGCPHHCKNCFNPETWDKNAGYEVPVDIEEKILKAISDNGIIRNLSILGGEPLAPWNLDFVLNIIYCVKKKYPNIKICIWTGYLLEDLISQNNLEINAILNNIDILVDGPFKEELKDLTLELRGSSNQRILYHGVDF